MEKRRKLACRHTAASAGSSKGSMDPKIAELSQRLWTERHAKESKLQDDRDHENRALVQQEQPR